MQIVAGCAFSVGLNQTSLCQTFKSSEHCPSKQQLDDWLSFKTRLAERGGIETSVVNWLRAAAPDFNAANEVGHSRYSLEDDLKRSSALALFIPRDPSAVRPLLFSSSFSSSSSSFSAASSSPFTSIAKSSALSPSPRPHSPPPSRPTRSFASVAAVVPSDTVSLSELGKRRSIAESPTKGMLSPVVLLGHFPAHALFCCIYCYACILPGHFHFCTYAILVVSMLCVYSVGITIFFPPPDSQQLAELICL